MADASEETNKSEDATPFKLDQARRKGMLARGSDLGFFSGLAALAIVGNLAGPDLLRTLSATMRESLSGTAAVPADPLPVLVRIWHDAIALAQVVLLPLLLLMAIGITVELVQNRGLVFSAQPLKPDFSRLNPAKGLKRVLSMRTLRELAKNLVKMGVYGTGAVLFLNATIAQTAQQARDGRQLAQLIADSAGRMLLLFIFLAAAMALLDQLLARREFARQMRMSRREVTRERREREGEPRQKQKRRQILAEIMKQAASAANVKGADVLIVNPIHYAVALRYRPDEDNAPIVQARGRNLWAARMRETANRDGIVIVRNPALARALYRESRPGQPIGSAHFVAVADIYIALRRALAAEGKP
ncbi:MAG: EscU/YscU/HrcU family type III secretion system export apparatus switch protein [Novosphingobium sp.]|uniref:EscU/YscU/HrcU family type III secretion system export apparatus switch protein n=1 Tax=Novosphingobium sp. TaxID=1874826 RepID=UPI0032B82EEF